MAELRQPKKGRKIYFSMCLSPEMLQKIDTMADAEYRNRNAMIEFLLMNYFKEYEKSVEIDDWKCFGGTREDGVIGGYT